jgi:hypothetical protein
MPFEKVFTVREIWNEVRSGTANFQDEPHYFCLFDTHVGEWSVLFELCPVDQNFMERELRYWKIFRDWEDRFSEGLVTTESPFRGGIDSEFDDLGEWLDGQIKLLRPLPEKYAAIFREVGGQERVPVGIRSELQVAWKPTSV